MSRWPRPASFWDYALPAGFMSGMTLFLVWLDASRGIGWLDVLLVVGWGAALFSAIGVLHKRHSNAIRGWLARGYWSRFLFTLVFCGALFLFLYADASILHPEDITWSRMVHDGLFMVLFSAGMALTLRGWSHRQAPPQNQAEQTTPLLRP